MIAAMEAGIPANLVGISSKVPGLCDPTALRRVEWWLEGVADGHVIRELGGQRCGSSLVLYGPPGTGKTMLAAHAAQQVLGMEGVFRWGPLNRVVARPRRPVSFIYYPELLETQKRVYDGDEEAGDIIDSAHGRGPHPVFVLVVDDLGKEQRTEWAWTRLDSLLRVRHQNGLPTIITTNVAPARWEAVYGEAMSNFMHRTSVVVPVKGVEQA